MPWRKREGKDLAGFKSELGNLFNRFFDLDFPMSRGFFKDGQWVPREIALKGMWATPPDPGAMSEYEIDFFGRKILFVNGFAANDPESSERIWRMALEKHPDIGRSMMILNSRADRPDRSNQLGEALVQWLPADRYVLIGSGVFVLLRKAVRSGLDSTKVVYAEGFSVDRIFEEIVGFSKKTTLVMGIGNIGGPGLELVEYFHNRTTI